MKQVIYYFILLFIVAFSRLFAQESSVFPRGEKSPSASAHHVGEVWLNELSKSDEVFNYNVAVAHFTPNSRLYWHKHPAGQILMILSGTGFYQERGKAKQIAHKGDVIKCQPDVEHWHGSTQDSEFTYLATTPTTKGKTIWLDPVSEEDYKLPILSEKQKPNFEQQLLSLSQKKWKWMAEKNVDSLQALFNNKAKFVHMGATFTKEQELNVIKSGTIQYKQAEIQESSVQFVENTAILLNKIRLTAIVGGNEVVNPFVVTEVYIHQEGHWTLGSMSFTKLLVP